MRTRHLAALLLTISTAIAAATLVAQDAGRVQYEAAEAVNRLLLEALEPHPSS